MHDILVTGIAGGVAGVAVDFALFPLDALKTRLQARPEDIRRATSLYAGLSSALLGSLPSSASFFFTYEFLKEHLVPKTDEKGVTRPHSSAAAMVAKLPPAAVHMISAGAGEIVATSVRLPFEVVKQQMQVGHHSSFVSAVRRLLAVGGVRSLYVGYLSTVARELPFDAIELSIWEALKKKLSNVEALRPAKSKAESNSSTDAAAGARDGKEVHPLASAIAGCVAGCTAAAFTTPLDVAKTRLMTQNPAGPQRYSGLIDCMRKVFMEEGYARLFSGLLPRTAWIGLGGFLFFGSFELCKQYLFYWARPLEPQPTLPPNLTLSGLHHTPHTADRKTESDASA
eukprot:GHVT01033925.1.p1 GENE.GHVT01033925.1~~GHVT01033925.1.p1  ORF type:complete len:341 (+),score=55.99 GHVT01033925.1:257-1279(+)